MSSRRPSNAAAQATSSQRPHPLALSDRHEEAHAEHSARLATTPQRGQHLAKGGGLDARLELPHLLLACPLLQRHLLPMVHRSSCKELEPETAAAASCVPCEVTPATSLCTCADARCVWGTLCCRLLLLRSITVTRAFRPFD